MNEQTTQIEYFPISPTRIKALDCPNFFKQNYLIEKTEEEKGDNVLTPLNLLEGKFCHRVIEVYNKTLIEQKQTADFEIFTKVLNELWRENIYIPESRFIDIQEMLNIFIETHAIDLDYIWGAEIEIALNYNLEKVEWMAEDVWLRAKLDRADIIPEIATGIITDYKTGYYIPPEGQLKKSLQTKIYPWIMSILNPYLEKFQIQYHFIRWNKKIGPIEFTLEDLKSVEDQLKGFTKRLTMKINDISAEWPALVGENCPICRFDCPLTAKGFIPTKTIEQAVDIGMQIQALKKKITELTKDIKRYSQVTDSRIDIGIGEYGFLPSETWKGVKPNQLVDFCLQKGIDLNLFLKIDTDKIRALDDDEIKQEIKKMFKIIPGTKFKFEEKSENKGQLDE